MTSSQTFYELIPAEDWDKPSFIDDEKFEASISRSILDGVIYGGAKSYRNMCHFNSGYFYRQKRLLNYDWYFRVEPDVEYMCDFQYDPFELLRINNKIYGFVIAIPEYENTIPTLWQTVEQFMEENPELIHANNSLDFITSNDTSLNHWQPLVPSSSKYNLCHFWSNFEIGNLNFFRSEAYGKYFDFLDKSGGFYYERWGDAPVHSIGLNILADKNSIHHFEDIGYYHAPYLACPTSRDVIASKRCVCKAYGYDGDKITKPVDVNIHSCLSRWWKYGAGKSFLNDIDYNNSI
ncbi:nucleotide-diphospho-sugar transferase [Scheffersomyces amazonensis]|uniref:nucleotide-diphospho-sugar transferase n=1 Tax=Scheffersomyces amazonensis TaxID=1078765 RepID=UPI00315DB30C